MSGVTSLQQKQRIFYTPLTDIPMTGEPHPSDMRKGGCLAWDLAIIGTFHSLYRIKDECMRCLGADKGQQSGLFPASAEAAAALLEVTQH